MTLPVVIDTTPWWIPFLSALGGGGIGAGGALLAGRWTQDREDKRRHRSQLEAIRAAKAERLRTLYAPLAAASLVLNSVAASLHYLGEGETAESRDERLNEEISRAYLKCQEVAGYIAIEPGAIATNNAFNEVTDNFARYFAVLPLERENPESFSEEFIQGLQEAIESGMKSVLDLARSQLQDLEEPAP